MAPTRQVVVVGAGVVGLCVAEALQREGHAVTVLERAPFARDGASFGNAGLIVPSHVVPLAAPGVLGQGLRWMLERESPFFIEPRLDRDLVRWGWAFLRSSTAAHVARSAPLLRDLHLRSRALHRTLAQRLPGARIPTASGLLLVCGSEHGLAEESALAERAAALGLDVEVMDAAGVAAKLPATDVRAIGGVYFRDDAHASPRGLMEALQKGLGERGVSLRWGADVVAVERRGDRVTGVRLAEGTRVEADIVVLAGGAATGRLVRSLGVRMPLQAGRGYSVTVAEPPQRPELPLILSEARVAVSPLPEGVRVGGTMEIVSPKRPPDTRRVVGIARGVERYLPAFRSETLTALPVWTGARPVSGDGLPYLGRLPTARQVIVATGHGMLGFSLAPVTAALVADLVAERPVDLDLALLAPERFTGRHVR